MNETRYTFIFNGVTICEKINRDDAMIMIEAFMQKYYEEPLLKIELVEDGYYPTYRNVNAVLGIGADGERREE